MAQSIDPNAIKWSGPAAEKQSREELKDDVNVQQGTASTRGSNASAAVNEAKLPYTPRQERAQTTKMEIDADRLSKGVPLDKEERKELGDLVSAVNRFDKLHTGFEDDFAGNMIDALGEAENTIQSRFSGAGTPGQSLWWQEKNFTDMMDRNKYFGASLTEGEKQAWAATTVSPGMDPKIVRANIAQRRAMANAALARTLDTFREGDYRPEQLRNIVGKDVYDRFANPATRAKFDAGLKREIAEINKNLGVAGGDLGENIKAPRLSPAGEAEITSYVRSNPGMTAEDYSDKLVDLYVNEKLIPEEQRASSREALILQAREYFDKISPDQRSKTPAGISYTEADRQAREGAGVIDTAGQALKNAPESAVGLVQGTIALPVDALVSLVSGDRYGSFRGMTDLAGEMLSSVGGEPSGPAMQAVGDMLSERYGSLQGFKEALGRDPLGVAGDVSLVLTAGGSAAARLPGALGKAGSAVATAGRVIDPLRALVAGVENTPNTIAAIPESVKNAPGAVAGAVMGLPTGVPGGQGFRAAARAGADRGFNGPTERSERFLDQMRGGDPSEVVARVEEAVRNMQADASRKYESGMIDTKNDATILDFGDIDKTLSNLRDRAYYNGQVKNQRAATVHERMSNLVDEWRGLDPEQYHTPMGMDALKQRLGDVGDDFRQNNDRRAAGIADGVYNAVRGSIARQVPSYDRTMRQYEQAQRTLRQIKTTFSVNPNASVDTQLRKLQSLLRNNANTNYGYRAELGRLVEDRGGVNIMDDLAGQSVSSWTPRGLMGLGAGTVAAGAGAGAMAQLINPLASATSLLNPANALALPLMSPRAMGEASYYAGVGAGFAGRGLGRGYEAIEPAMDALRAKYQQHPASTLAAARAGDVLSQVGEPEEQTLPEGLPLEIPAIAEEAPQLPPGATIDEETGDLVLEDGTRIPLSKMASGGSVKRTWGDAGREVAKGATFAHGDEIEAAARAIAQGDPSRYRAEVNRIRGEMRRAQDAAPYKSLGLEMAGAIAPSLVARKPVAANRALAGMAQRYPQIASAMRAAPTMPGSFGMISRLIPGMSADAAMAALYGAGEAETMSDVPAAMLREMPESMMMYSAMSGAGSGLKRGFGALKRRYLGVR